MANQNKYRGGVRKDLRKESEKVKHIYISGLINWTLTPIIPGIKPVQRNQEGTPDSSSCVCQSKMSQVYSVLGIVASAQPPFARRIGAPTSDGCYLSDIDQLMYTDGTNLESINPSEKMSDVQLDVHNDIPLTIKSTGPGIDVDLNADAIASAILFAKAVSVTFESNESEWDMPNCTPVYNSTTPTFGHCISLYGFFLNNGVKTFLANDSDGQWSSPTGLRYITEAFLLARATGASYSPNFVVIDTSTTVPIQATTTPIISTKFNLIQFLKKIFLWIT